MLVKLEIVAILDIGFMNIPNISLLVLLLLQKLSLYLLASSFNLLGCDGVETMLPLPTYIY